MFIPLNISSILSTPNLQKSVLSWSVISDNVLHKQEACSFNCDTLSEARYDKEPHTKTTSGFPFFTDTLLDDQTVGGRNGVHHSLGPQVLDRNRVLQQLYPQRLPGTPFVRYHALEETVCGFTAISVFSRAGTLTKTLVSLISGSPAGMSAEMLGKTLQCRCHGLLVNLWRKGDITREKVGRCQVYFANDPHKSANQRRALTAQHSPKKLFGRDGGADTGSVLSGTRIPASSSWPRRFPETKM